MVCKASDCPCVLSGPTLLMHAQVVQTQSHGEVATQMSVGTPLVYMCAAAYYSLFKLGIFSFYHMVPHATDPHSLLMNAAQVSRFAAPLAFNFLHVVRMQTGLRNGQVKLCSWTQHTFSHCTLIRAVMLCLPTCR